MRQRRRLCTGLAAFFAAGVAACRPVTLLNAVIPTRQLQVSRDIAYGDQPRQALDVYHPVTPPSTPLPVMVFFYGGSWVSGSKQDYLFVAEALVSRGYVVVIADYRLYPQVKFPALMQDPAQVLRWVIQSIATYHGDPRHLFVMGHSAGAHLATMLSLDPAYLAEVGLQPTCISGTIGLAGPYDFLPLTTPTLKAIFAPPADAWRGQPIRFAHAGAPPMLLITGLKDAQVWPKNSRNLAKALQDAGSEVELLTYANYDHVDMVAKLARPLRGGSPLLDDIDGWCQRHV